MNFKVFALLLTILYMGECQSPVVQRSQDKVNQISEESVDTEAKNTGSDERKGQSQSQPETFIIVDQSPPASQPALTQTFVVTQPQKPQVVISRPPPQPQQQIIVSQHPSKPLPEQVIVSLDHRHCTFVGRKGRCNTVPNFFSCIREGGILAPDVLKCGFVRACCIYDFFRK